MPRNTTDDQPPPKTAVIQIRVDSELAAKIAQKARRYGGASVVIRALLRKWAEHEGVITADEILAEVPRAAYGSKKSKEQVMGGQGASILLKDDFAKSQAKAQPRSG